MGLLTRIGIGAATVDTVLATEELTAGEPVDAEIRIEGGDDEQEVEGVYLALATHYYREDNGRLTGVVDRFELAESFTIDPDEERTLETTVDVPIDTPITVGDTEVWVDTGLEVDWALDPEDRDHVSVDPTDRLARVLDAMEDLSLHRRTTQCERAPAALGARLPFVQTFEYVPHGGQFAAEVEEVELRPIPTEEQLTLYVEVDRTGGVLQELEEAPHGHERLVIKDEEREAVRKRLQTLIAGQL